MNFYFLLGKRNAEMILMLKMAYIIDRIVVIQMYEWFPRLRNSDMLIDGELRPERP